MEAKFVLTVLLLFCLQNTKSQKLLTIAEKSDYKSTSEHSDVVEFINSLKKII